MLLLVDVDVNVVVDPRAQVAELVLLYVKVNGLVLADSEDDWDMHADYDVEVCLCASSG